MAQYKMLDEFVHYCGKCKLELNHRIVLMDGDQPGRVLCLTCNTERKYKVPSDATLKRARKKKAAGPGPKALAEQQKKEWAEMLNNPGVTPIQYKISESFNMNDHVAHPKFGKGLVVGFEYPDKIQVFFDNGIKILKGLRASQ